MNGDRSASEIKVLNHSLVIKFYFKHERAICLVYEVVLFFWRGLLFGEGKCCTDLFCCASDAVSFFKRVPLSR